MNSASHIKPYTSSFYIDEIYSQKVRDGRRQAIRLTSKWWTMYHAEVARMKDQLVKNRKLKKQQDNTVFHLLTFPISIGILKRIIFIRAAAGENIYIEGLIDGYFYACAHSEGTKKHMLMGIDISLKHGKNSTHTIFRFEKTKNKRHRTRMSTFRDTQLLKAINMYPLMRYTFSDSDRHFHPLRHNAITPLSRRIFDYYTKEAARHKGEISLGLYETTEVFWRMSLKEGFSIALISNYECKGDAAVECGVSCGPCQEFFIIEYNNIPFVYKCDSVDDIRKKIIQIFSFATQNKNTIKLSMKIKNFPQQWKYRSIDAFIKHQNVFLDPEHSEHILKSLETESYEKDDAMQAVMSRTRPCHDEIDVSLGGIQLDGGTVAYAKCVIGAMVKDARWKKSMLIIMKGFSFDINSMGEKVTELNLWLMINRKTYYNQSRDHGVAQNKKQFDKIVARLYEWIKLDVGVQRVVGNIIDTLIQMFKDQQTFEKLMARTCISGEQFNDFCDHLIIRKGSEFTLDISRGVVVVCTGLDRSARIYHAVKILFQAITSIHSLSLDAYATQIRKTVRTYFKHSISRMQTHVCQKLRAKYPQCQSQSKIAENRAKARDEAHGKARGEALKEPKGPAFPSYSIIVVPATFKSILFWFKDRIYGMPAHNVFDCGEFADVKRLMDEDTKYQQQLIAAQKQCKITYSRFTDSSDEDCNGVNTHIDIYSVIHIQKHDCSKWCTDVDTYFVSSIQHLL